MCIVTQRDECLSKISLDFFVQCPSLDDPGRRGGVREREERNSLILRERKGEREGEVCERKSQKELGPKQICASNY